MLQSKKREVKPFGLDLDAAVSLTKWIKRGHYDYVNANYTPENFRLTLSGRRKIALIDPRGCVSSREMIRRMKHEGLVPATLDAALAFCVAYPERQRHNPLVFLGTVWRDPSGNRRVPVLFGCDNKRKLHLGWFDQEWFFFFRFATLRESQSAPPAAGSRINCLRQ